MAVLDGRVYTGADDGNIYCLDAVTGNLIWTASEPTDDLRESSLVRSSPTVSGDKLYVGSLDGNVYCYSTSGNLIWTYPTGGVIHATPVVVDNELYITAAIPYVNGLLIKLNAETGTQIWNFTIPYYQFYSSAIYASPTVAEGVVYARSDFRYTFAVNASTGEQIWMYNGRYNPSTPFQSGGTALYDAVLYKYGRVYFNDYYGFVCLNATDATELWFTYLPRETFSQGATYSYNRLYVVTDAKVLYVLDALNGEKLSYFEDIGLSRSSPTPYNGDLYVTSTNFGVYCFEEAPPPEPYTPPPEPTYPTADEIAQKVLDELPASPSAGDIAGAIISQLPEGITAQDVADKVLANLPEGPSAEDVAQETINRLPAYPEMPEIPEIPAYLTIDLAIIAAVVIAIIIGLYGIVKKQK